jgi:aldehyde dehydrogenase (NAD+)
MPSKYTHHFDTPLYKGDVTINTDLFINGQWVEPVESDTIEIVNPSTGCPITTIAAGASKDVDIAVEAASKAYKTSWGLHCSGDQRGKLLMKLVNILESHVDELTALEALNVGKKYSDAYDCVVSSIDCIRYYAGWADKIHGFTIETNESRLAYTRHEPFGVVGQIIPWNFPIDMLAWKIGPALATGNTIVLKPSELTPFTALKVAEYVAEAGFPAGVVNIVNGYGNTVGQAISEHPHIRKVAFTGSTLNGRKILKAAAESNLKVVTLELGGKSPVIVFDDVNVESVAEQAAIGIFYNMGQVCTAGSRIFVQETIYDEFLAAISGIANSMGAATGDPFQENTLHGPQVSKIQHDRVLGYINHGKQEGATVHAGGHQIGTEGYFIHPTIFTDVKPEMKIAREEIFGPVAVVVRFKDEAEVIELANDTAYGLACSVFSENTGRAHRVAHAIEAGSVWVNTTLDSHHALPFGGYKMSGIGRELGKYALDTYTQVKSVHVRL